MQLVLHTGAHFTEQERLIKSIRRNAFAFEKRGIAVPDPEIYRGLLRDTLNAMGRASAGPEAREVLLDVLLDGSVADRLVLSDANFFRTAGTAIQRGVLYPAAARRMVNMALLFPTDTLEIFVGIRNPATLVPILYAHAADQDLFWGAQGPEDILWSGVIGGLRDALPNVPVTVWCSEDMPLLWAQIVREICALDPQEKIVGGFDLLSHIMRSEGMERFRAYLAEHPQMNEIQKRRVIAAFLDKYAIDDVIEEEVDMPGWDAALIDRLTDLYDQDVENIQRMAGVTMLLP
ncbi:MAG: hypothetical protein AAF943_17250 [Pseudomonadota bacterium]